MTKTGRVAKLNQHVPEPFLQINPEDAAARGIEADQLVTIRGRRGEVRVKVQLSDDVRQGVCFLPMHWGKILNSTLERANNLTNSLVDPRSKEPDYKFTAVQVELYQETSRKNSS